MSLSHLALIAWIENMHLYISTYTNVWLSRNLLKRWVIYSKTVHARLSAGNSEAINTQPKTAPICAGHGGGCVPMAGAAGPVSLQIHQLNSRALQTQPASNNHFLFTARCHRSLLTYLLDKRHNTKKAKTDFFL